jgi:hypothetical protein
MKFIGKDEVLFELLKDVQIRLLDSMIKRINIFTQGIEELYIEIDFDYSQYQGCYLRLKFSDIKEYSFYHNNTHTFSYVECFKLIKDGEFFYFSFDPEDEFSTVASETDQDLIVCGSFEGHFIAP